MGNGILIASRLYMDGAMLNARLSDSSLHQRASDSPQSRARPFVLYTRLRAGHFFRISGLRPQSFSFHSQRHHLLRFQ